MGGKLISFLDLSKALFSLKRLNTLPRVSDNRTYRETRLHIACKEGLFDVVPMMAFRINLNPQHVNGMTHW